MQKLVSLLKTGISCPFFPTQGVKPINNNYKSTNNVNQSLKQTINKFWNEKILSQKVREISKLMPLFLATNWVAWLFAYRTDARKEINN